MKLLNALNKPYSLQYQPSLGNNKALTKNSSTQCQALNMAFFVPKILGVNLSYLGMKDRILNKYGRVNGRIQDLFGGNKSSRVRAISDTRPPESKSGGITKNSNGGLVMPTTSKRAAIRTIQTVTTPSGIIATIHTRYNQKAVIGRLFTSFDQLKSFVLAQGLSLDLLGGRI